MENNVQQKKPFYKKWWFWLIVVIVIIGVAGNSSKQPQKIGSIVNPTTSSSSDASTQTPVQNTVPPESFKIGDQVKLGDYILLVNSEADCKSSNQFMVPKSGNKFIVLDLSQENDGSDSISYNALNFKLQDDKDYTYNYAFSTCKAPDFGSGDLQKGQKTRGFLTFELPKDNKPTKLIFTPGLLSTDQIMIDLQ